MVLNKKNQHWPLIGVIFVALAFLSCVQNSSKGLITSGTSAGSGATSSLVLTASLPTVMPGESITFSASGGTGSYNYFSSSGFPINSATGIYTPTLATTITTDKVVALDSNNLAGTLTFPIRSLQSVASRSNLNSSYMDPDGNLFYVVPSSSSLIWTVKKSTDYGQNWVTVDSFPHLTTGIDAGDTFSQAFTVSFNYSNPLHKYIYVAGISALDPNSGVSGGSFIIRKSDNGTWSTLSIIPVTANVSGTPTSVSAAVLNNGVIFLYMHSSDWSGWGVEYFGTQVSIDAGATFSALSRPGCSSSAGTSVTMNNNMFSNGSTLIYSCGIAGTGTYKYFRTTDGVTWTNLNTLSTMAGDYKTQLIDNLGQYFITDNAHVLGLQRSTDSGASWSAVNTDKTIAKIFQNSLGHLFAISPAGIYKSTNNGTSWYQVDNRGVSDACQMSPAGVLYCSVGATTYSVDTVY